MGSLARKLTKLSLAGTKQRKSIFGYTAHEAINNNISIIIHKELYQGEEELSVK